MMFAGIKVLLLRGCERQILPYLRAFKEMGCETTVLCSSKSDLGFVSRFADKKIIGICSPDKVKETESCLEELIMSGYYDVVVPMGDFAAKILATNKTKWSKYSSIAVNDEDIFLKALDKEYVMQVCIENNIPCPKTIIGLESKNSERLYDLEYPIVVKPKSECGAKGFHRFDRKEDFLEFASTIDLSTYVIQEYIPQTLENISCGLFIDSNGEVKSSYSYISRRWYPIEGGTGTLNETTNKEDVLETCSHLASIIGLRGVVGFDLIRDPRDGIAKVIEINPRVLACAKIGFEAGVNQAQQLLEDCFVQTVHPFKMTDKCIRIRMSQIDFLWFLKSPNRFISKPSWFSLRYTKDQTFSWQDPLPWFAFLFDGLSRMKNDDRYVTQKSGLKN